MLAMNPQSGAVRILHLLVVAAASLVIGCSADAPVLPPVVSDAALDGADTSFDGTDRGEDGTSAGYDKTDAREDKGDSSVDRADIDADDARPEDGVSVLQHHKNLSRDGMYVDPAFTKAA